MLMKGDLVIIYAQILSIGTYDGDLPYSQHSFEKTCKVFQPTAELKSTSLKQWLTHEKSKPRWQSTYVHTDHTQPIILTGHLNISHVSFFHTNDITCDFHHYSDSRFDTPPVINQVLAVGFWGCKSCVTLLAKDILQIFYGDGGG